MMYKRVAAVVLAALVLIAPAGAMSWDDTESDWDARILQAIDDPATWGMVLSEVEALPEDAWGMIDTVSIPPVSQSTRALIRDRLAVDNRMPDNRFRHMPHVDEGWAIHLIVDAVILVVSILIGYVATPYVSAWLASKQAANAAAAVPVAAPVAPAKTALEMAVESANAALEMARTLKISSATMSSVEAYCQSAQSALNLQNAWEQAMYAWDAVERSVRMCPAGAVDAATASAIQNAALNAQEAFFAA